MINQTENEHCLINHHPHVCWSAIFAGAFVGVGLGFLLHLFGSAIGLSAYSSTSTGAQAIAIGGILGFLIGVIVSMFAAGYVAGYLGRFQQCMCHGGIIYGFVTWSMALALSALLIIPLTKYSFAYKYNLAQTVMQKTTNPNMHTPSAGQPQKVMDDIAAKPTTASELAWSAWIMFILFFIGALSSCLGACMAMCCKKAVVVERPTIPMH